MSLSSIAVEQREREAKKLNSFLAFGLIGSLALHIGLLSINIGNLSKKAAEVKDEPLEIEIVELPDTQPELKPAPQAQASQASSGNSSGSGSEGGSIALSSSDRATPASASTQRSSNPAKIARSQSVIEAEKPPISVAPAKVERLRNQPILPPKVAQTPKTTVNRQLAPSEITTQQKPLVTPPPLVAASPKPAPIIQKTPVAVNRPATNPTPTQQPSDRQLRNLLASTRNTQPRPNNISAASKPSGLSERQASIASNLRARRGKATIDGAANGSSIATGNNLTGSFSSRTGSGSSTGISGGNGSGSGTGTARGNGAGSGTGIARGNGAGSGTGIGRGNGSGGSRNTTNRGSGSTVATGAQNGNQRTARPESSNTGSRASGGLGCIRCSKPKYPDRARRRGLEGKTEISVDVDSKGNVTNVRLARSSGHSELDKAALAEARRWKLKPTDGGARGLSAKVDFAIEGSERSRKRQERRKKRQQIEQRRTTPTTETANAPSPTRRMRNSTSTQNESALTRRIRRNSPPIQNATAPRRTQITTSRRRVDTLPPRRAGDVPQRQRAGIPQANGQARLRQSLRRQRSNSNRATPTSQTNLRQTLRLHQQNSQPATSPASE